MAYRYECDCGATYSNLDALHACQNNRHGQRLPGTIEVSENEYRALLKERDAMLVALKRALEYVDGWPRDNMQRVCIAQIKDAIKLAEEE